MRKDPKKANAERLALAQVGQQITLFLNRKFKGLDLLPAKAERSETGWRMKLGASPIVEKDVQFEVWADRYHGGRELSVWFGIYAESDRAITPYKELYPDAIRITDRQVDYEVDPPVLVGRIPEELLVPFSEDYGSDGKYLGQYLSLGQCPTSRLVSGASQFTKAILRRSEELADLEELSDPYLRNTNASLSLIVRQHRRLVKDFRNFAIVSLGATSLRREKGGVDLQFQLNGSLVLCEMKPTSPENVRFAIRFAMGQLFDYSQDIPHARLCIVLDRRPTQRDADLAKSKAMRVFYRVSNGFREV